MNSNPYQNLHEHLAALKDKRLIPGYTNPTKASRGLHCAFGAMLTEQERVEAVDFGLHMLTTHAAQARAGFCSVVGGPLVETFEDRIRRGRLVSFLDGTDVVRKNDAFGGSPEERYSFMLEWTAKRAGEWDDTVASALSQGYNLYPAPGSEVLN